MNQTPNEVCHNHPQLTPAFICTACQTNFCRHCVKFINTSSVTICRLCGSLCLPFAEVKQKRLLTADQETAFGSEDFKFALGYPLTETFTLLGIAAIYGAGFYSLSFYSLANIGVVLGSIGLLPAFVVNAMMFGCVSLIIKRLETGRTDSEDIFDLSYLLSEFWTPVRLAAGIFLAIGWPTVLGLKLSSVSFVEQTPFNRLLIFAWTIFYYPIALLVASVSGSFWATINPLVGLSVIHKLGAAFFKLLAFYCLLVAVALAFVYLITSTILQAGFNMMLFLILGILVAPPIFYANMVLGCLLGRALFKAGDKI